MTSSTCINGDLALLHRSESGVNGNLVDFSAYSCAGELARYITCPSTIRSRVMDRFGKAPPIEAIRELQQKRRDERAKYKHASDQMEAEPEDIFSFRVNGKGQAKPYLVPEPEPEEAPALVPSQFVPPVLASDTIASIAKDFGLTYSVLVGRGRTRKVVHARRTAMYVLVKRGASLSSVGRRFGRDHTTVLHNVREFEQVASEEMQKIAMRYIGEDR